MQELVLGDGHSFGCVNQNFERRRGGIAAMLAGYVPIDIALDDARGCDALQNAAGLPVHHFRKHLLPFAAFFVEDANIDVLGVVAVELRLVFRFRAGVSCSLGYHRCENLLGYAFLLQLDEILGGQRIIARLILDHADDQALTQTSLDHLHDCVIVQNFLPTGDKREHNEPSQQPHDSLLSLFISSPASRWECHRIVNNKLVYITVLINQVLSV